MNRASPHTEQPHSGHSPSGTSGQPTGDACICSNSRSPLHPVQYLALSYGLMPGLHDRLREPIGNWVLQ